MNSPRIHLNRKNSIILSKRSQGHSKHKLDNLYSPPILRSLETTHSKQELANFPLYSPRILLNKITSRTPKRSNREKDILNRNYIMIIMLPSVVLKKKNSRIPQREMTSGEYGIYNTYGHANLPTYSPSIHRGPSKQSRDP